MKQASKLFEGLHDFRTFMARGSKDPDKMTRRVVNRVEIIEGKPLTSCSYSWPSFMCPSREDYQYYDVYVQASGFLYRQVSVSNMFLMDLVLFKFGAFCETGRQPEKIGEV
jgi:tRNA U38,U39,U40 pseudouridine synthase TruA